MNLGWATLGLSLAVIVVLALVPRVETGRASAFWLRWVAPNYRFFESTQADVELEFRPVTSNGTVLAWERVIPGAVRSPFSLFWNPEGTLRLFAYQLVDDLLCELAEVGPISLAQVQGLERFERLCQLVLLYHSPGPGAEIRLQIRIVQTEPHGREVLFESDVLDVRRASEGKTDGV